MRTNWVHGRGAATIMTVVATIATPNTALADILGCEIDITRLEKGQTMKWMIRDPSPSYLRLSVSQ